MFIAAQNLQKSYGLHVILDNISFVINEKECIGLVGPNGAGKSTLIRILAGEEEKESGTLSFATNLQVGYLPQTTPPFYGLSIQDLIQEAMGGLKQLEERIHKLEQLMSTASAIEIQPLLEEYQQTTTLFQDRGGYDLDYKINEILAGLRLNYLPREQAVEDLSGGEKARVHLAILLLRSPDLLLLDEPTNHLDFESMAWLESFLHNYTGSILIVSHDRQFLNRTVNTILELDHDSHQLKRYTGNYDAYMSAKVAERKQWEEDYLRQQEEIQDLRKRIKTTGRAIGHTNRKPRDNDKFAPYFFAQNVQKAVSSNIRAAQAQLERIEADPVPEPPDLLSISTHFQSEPLPSSLALTIRHLHKRFGERVILDDLNLELSSRSRILLVGH